MRTDLRTYQVGSHDRLVAVSCIAIEDREMLLLELTVIVFALERRGDFQCRFHLGRFRIADAVEASTLD